jgi:transposase
MELHGNARLTPHGRTLMCQRVRDEGWTVAEAAEAAGCSERTCYRWLVRYDAGEALADRSSAPHRVPGRTPAETETLIAQLRHLRWTSTQIAAELDLATSTVCAVLRRQGLHRLSRLEPPEPPNRYCRRHPGELIHIDIKKLGRFDRPGLPAHRRHGGYRATYRAGWDYVHVAVDDTSRLAYVEILNDEKGATCVGFLRRAIAWFATRGVTVVRIMTDTAAATARRSTPTPSPSWRSSMSGLGPTGPGPTARPNGSSRPSKPSGPTPPATRTTTNEPRHSHPGSSTTTSGDHTAPSATSRPPPASPRLTNAPGIYN